MRTYDRRGKSIFAEIVRRDQQIEMLRAELERAMVVVNAVCAYARAEADNEPLRAAAIAAVYGWINKEGQP